MTGFRCVKCGKISAGRMPRKGRHTGDTTVRFPRLHRGADGQPCPGNVWEAEWVERPAAGGKGLCLKK
jgi:hypothetical protein